MTLKIYTSFNNFEKNYKKDYKDFAKKLHDYTYDLYIEDLLIKYSKYYETNYLKDKIFPIYDLSCQETQLPKLIDLSESLSFLEEYFIENDNEEFKNILAQHNKIIVYHKNESLDFSEYSFLLNFLKLERDFYDLYHQKTKETHLILDYNSIDNLYTTFDKIIRYLKSEIINLESEKEIFENTPNDIKNSIKKKIIYLNELGIIDFLKIKPPYSTSNNKIAEVISILIEEKQGSIQPYINDLINKNKHSKNYPYNNLDIVNSVKKTLTDKGLQ